MKKLLIILLSVSIIAVAGIGVTEAKLSEKFIEPYRDHSKPPFPICKHIIAFDEDGNAYREWYRGECGSKTTGRSGDMQYDKGIEPTIKNP